jgi:hypothetical protein
MANAFSDYAVSGPADPRRARGAALVDLGIGAFLAVLVWPFPVMRLVLTDAAGSVLGGWVVHVALLLIFMAVMDGLYSAVAIAMLHRTAGMYLQDVGFREGGPGRGVAFAAGVFWALAGVAGAFGVIGPAARAAERSLGSTRADERSA